MYIRWLVLGLLILSVTGCRTHYIPEPTYQLDEDYYLVEMKPCGCPRQFRLVPTDSGFYERSLESGVGFAIVCFPSAEEFYNDPYKWICWRFAYPLASGKYRLIDLVPAQTPYHFVPPGEGKNYFCCEDYTQIVLDCGPYQGFPVYADVLGEPTEKDFFMDGPNETTENISPPITNFYDPLDLDFK